MSKIICFIFGHLPYTYNGGTYEDPEQAWACSYCNKDLTYGDEYWGLNLNNKITKLLKGKDKEIDNKDLPF